jgi:serine/threonine protein kinase
MGTCSLADRSNGLVWVSTSDFRFRQIIGKGGFGRVWRVEWKKDGLAYAMKMLSKAKILHKHSVHSIMNERKLLALLNHK